MNFNKPKTSGIKPAVIRTRTVNVAKSNVLPSTAPLQRPVARHSDPDRFRKALERPGPKPLATKKAPIAAQRALSVSRGIKRKSSTPQPINMFSDDEEDQSSDFGGSDSDASRKRVKSSVSSVESRGPRRKIALDHAFQQHLNINVVNGADATSGPYSPKFKPPWDYEDVESIRLQYPTKSQPERFELKFPKNFQEDYRPMEDITQTIDIICTFYFPENLSSQCLDDSDGFKRRFERAWNRQSIDMFKEVVKDFNKLVSQQVADGSVEKALSNKPNTLDLNWVTRILDQIYARTVSPKVETLRAYENGTDYVYGELLPRFCNTIFQQTKLDQEKVFLDLGSGVGNVVLQAALQVGCESWGIEIMKNPTDLANLQATEFAERTKLWGLSPGKINLLRGDFMEDIRIRGVLKRADVVLVNNQAFTAELNRKLADLFLDLKDGCQIVSLKPFKPDGWKIKESNMYDTRNQLRQKRFEYFSDSVSWADGGGNYYIATKDPSEQHAFMKKHKLI